MSVKSKDGYDIKQCGTPECNPKEQIRGLMGPGDYFDVIAANAPGATSSSDTIPNPETYGERVERDPSGDDDYRICCQKCGKATGWQHKDAPGMPGVGIFWSITNWNKSLG